MLNFSQTILQIVDKIEIEQNFIVRHPDYPPLELEPDLITRLERISPQLQSKYLAIQVQNYLYNIYFSHSVMSTQELDIVAKQPIQIKNNIINGIDIDLCLRLQQSNTSNGYIDPDWQVVAETKDELIVVKDGLHLHIERQQHLPKLSQSGIGDTIPIYLPHNLVGQDTYIIIGNLGSPDRAKSVEIYFNFTPNAAVAIAQKLTSELNRLGIPFQFAILHDPALFYRYDAGTLWLPQTGYIAVFTVLVAICQAHQADFSPDVPLFTQHLAPGLGIAEVPNTPGSFGMQRCQLLATGLLTAMKQGKTLTNDKLDTIRKEFATAGIDWMQPDLHPSASDGDIVE